MTATTFYSIPVKDASGKPFDLGTHCKGKVVLVVNVASKCGFTPQYKGLEELNKKYREKGLVILGAPCNQFGGQEPGSSEEVVSFCSVNYGVSFPILEKMEVNGDNVHPLFVFLKDQKKGLLGLSRIKWNFEKFLIDKEGNVVDRFASITTPDALAARIEALL